MADNRAYLKKYNDVDKSMDDLFRKAAANAGVSESAFDILYSLEVFGGDCTQKELCDHCWLGKQTINSSIKRMVEMGLIDRRPGAGRSTKISLTEAGEDLVARKVRPFVKAESAAIESLGKEGREALLSAYTAYRDAFVRLATKAFEGETGACK